VDLAGYRFDISRTPTQQRMYDFIVCLTEFDNERKQLTKPQNVLLSIAIPRRCLSFWSAGSAISLLAK
jgi:hypothetical protein